MSINSFKSSHSVNNLFLHGQKQGKMLPNSLRVGEYPAIVGAYGVRVHEVATCVSSDIFTQIRFVLKIIFMRITRRHRGADGGMHPDQGHVGGKLGARSENLIDLDDQERLPRRLQAPAQPAPDRVWRRRRTAIALARGQIGANLFFAGMNDLMRHAAPWHKTSTG
jgi:hypothetical protein